MFVYLITDIKYAKAVIKSANVKHSTSFRVKFRISGSVTKVIKITTPPINDKLQLVADIASTSTEYVLMQLIFTLSNGAVEVAVVVVVVVLIVEFMLLLEFHRYLSSETKQKSNGGLMQKCTL